MKRLIFYFGFSALLAACGGEVGSIGEENPLPTQEETITPTPTEAFQPQPTAEPSITPPPDSGGGPVSPTTVPTSPATTPTVTPTVVITPPVSSTPVATATPIIVVTPTATATPTDAATPTPTAAPTIDVTPTPTLEPTPKPTTTPTSIPSGDPEPTTEPEPLPPVSMEPTPTPTMEPTPSEPLTDFEKGRNFYFDELGSSGSCASCHGASGEGVPGRGGKVVDCGHNCNSLAALEAKIDISMPIGGAQECRGDCAKLVSEFIWVEFMGKALPTDQACDMEVQKASPMRRLNRKEVSNAINDIFGTGGDEIYKAMPEETEVIGGFATVGSALTTSRDWTDTYFNGVIDAVDRIVDTGAFAADCSLSGDMPIVEAPIGDQCNTTNECKATFGDQATDCADSRSDQSICMCGQNACATSSGPSSAQCFEKDIAKVGELLFREPLAEADLTRLKRLYSDAGSNKDGIKHALGWLLVSPKFLFSIPADDKTTSRSLNDKELADRLALTLWGSIPDKALLDAAASKKLSSGGLSAEIDRMVADPRFDRFVEIFVDPWIGLGGYQIEGADVGLSDADWQALIEDMKTETRLFVAHIVKNNLPVDELYTANYSFLNRRLANHYGIPFSDNSGGFVKTALPESSHRRGLMTQGAVLAKAFDGEKTSVVKRGVVPLEAFTCTAPEPPDDPSIEEAVNEQANSAQTEKEKLATRADPTKACAGCHAVIDPIGWVFTEFGAAGQAVTTDPDGDPLDTSGELFGAGFHNAYEMVDIIAEEGHFSSCFSTKFLIHSLGRRVSKTSSEDSCAIESAIEKATVDNKTGAKDLIRALLTSNISIRSGTVTE